MTKPHMTTSGDKTYSYSTCIRQVLPGGLVLGNLTYYSRTTARHAVLCGADKADVILANVPQGIKDLLPLAIQRGLVDVWYQYDRESLGMTRPIVRRAVPDNTPLPP